MVAQIQTLIIIKVIRLYQIKWQFIQMLARSFNQNQKCQTPSGSKSVGYIHLRKKIAVQHFMPIYLKYVEIFQSIKSSGSPGASMAKNLHITNIHGFNFNITCQ